LLQELNIVESNCWIRILSGTSGIIVKLACQVTANSEKKGPPITFVGPITFVNSFFNNFSYGISVKFKA